MGTFTYISVVAPVIFCQYLIVFGIFYYLDRVKSQKVEFSKLVSATTTSIFGGRANYVLLITRLMSFGYFGGVAVVYGFTLEITNWNYFTHWNLYLISFTFLLLATCSFSGLFLSNKLDKPEYQKRFEYLFTISSFVYEVAGASALFVTTVNFVLLSASFDFWNVTDHFVTTCTFLIELSLNNMSVNMLHYYVNITWVCIYCIFTWIVVSDGVRAWPYDFMKTTTASSVAWYEALFIIDFLFYCLWYYLHKLKVRIGSELLETNSASATVTVQQQELPLH